MASQDMTRIQVQRQAVKWTSGRQQGDKSRIVSESGNDPSEIRSHLEIDRDTNPETKNKSRVRWIHTKFNQVQPTNFYKLLQNPLQSVQKCPFWEEDVALKCIERMWH